MAQEKTGTSDGYVHRADCFLMTLLTRGQACRFDNSFFSIECVFNGRHDMYGSKPDSHGPDQPVHQNEKSRYQGHCMNDIKQINQSVRKCPSVLESSVTRQGSNQHCENRYPDADDEQPDHNGKCSERQNREMED